MVCVQGGLNKSQDYVKWEGAIMKQCNLRMWNDRLVLEMLFLYYVNNECTSFFVVKLLWQERR